MRTLLVSWLWAIFALALVACGQALTPQPVAEPTSTPLPAELTPTPTPEPIAVRVILREFSIESSLSTFTPGTTYRFSITNRGDLAHQFVLEPLDALDEPLTAEGREAKVGTDRHSSPGLRSLYSGLSPPPAISR